MPKQVLISLLIESGLVTLTTMLLTQPRPIFSASSERIRTAITMSGLVCLCVTFCWSVVFGCILALHEISARL